MEKPIFPVLINDSQIPIGQNWTIICPLQANHSYHIYCYGAWINTSSQAKTDYDFYVYDPQGNLVGTHTESAGLPPHLGTTVDNPLFTPTQSGNYSFVIVNNPVDSVSAQQATFMIIETLQCDQWYTTTIQGSNGNDSNFNTCWAYEFATNASYLELYVQVPNTLDMYEARLYLMNNGNSSSLDAYPLPWEPGLYGNLTGSVGGYNFESEGYRGVAYASCEYMGQSMFLNYTSNGNATSTGVGENLYQVVLIGEVGSGDVQFMLKTNFENSTLIPLTPPNRIQPNSPTELAFTSNDTDLASAQLSYTNDNWTDVKTVDMLVDGQVCNGTIPGQPAGTLVQYLVNATDVQENNWEASGNYTVKEPTVINITAVQDKLKFGENITVNGVITPISDNSSIQVQFLTANSVQIINCTELSDGTFKASYKPNVSGNWTVIASSSETPTAYLGYSQELLVTVAPQPIYVKYSLYLIGGFFGVIGAGVAVWFLKYRGK